MTDDAVADFDFVAHADSLGAALLPWAHNGSAPSVNAPSLRPLLLNWLRGANPTLQWYATQTATLRRDPAVYEHLVAQIPSAHERYVPIGGALMADDRALELVRGEVARDETMLMRNHEGAIVLAAMARTEPEAFEAKAQLWVEDTLKAAKNALREAATGRRAKPPPPTAGSMECLFGSIALAPSLSDALRDKIVAGMGRAHFPTAFACLYAHDHRPTVRAVAAPSDFVELVRSVGTTRSAGALFVLLDDGPARLRQLLLDPSFPLDWSGMVHVAIDLGIWDDEVVDAYLSALARGATGAASEGYSLPLLEDASQLKRYEAAFEGNGTALGMQCSDSSLVPDAMRARLWRLETEPLVRALAALGADDVPRATILARDARRAGQRLVDATAALRACDNPVTQLVLALASSPPPRSWGLADTSCLHCWALEVQSWVRRWYPAGRRSNEAPSPARVRTS